MRLQTFINERVDDPITQERAINSIKLNCKNYLKKIHSGVPMLWRGHKSVVPYILAHPNFGQVRRSVDGFNHMTLLIDNLPSWSEYPKRGKSIICTTHANQASAYGNLYAVYPYDDADMGICRSRDIWWSFTGLGSVSAFNSILNARGVSDGTWQSLVKTLNEAVNDDIYVFNKKVEAMKKGEPTRRWRQESDENPVATLEEIIDLIADKWKLAYKGGEGDILRTYIITLLLTHSQGRKYKDIITYLNEILEPKRNGFRLNNLAADDKSGKEVWVGNAPCIMVNTQGFQALKDEGLMV